MYTLLIIGAVVILVLGIPAADWLMNRIRPPLPSRKRAAGDSARHAEASIDSGGRNDRGDDWAAIRSHNPCADLCPLGFTPAGA